MSVVETFPFSFFMINLLANIVISPTQMTFFLEHSCSSTSSPFELVLGFKPSIILFCYQSMLKFINTFTWVVCSIQVQILVFINYNIFILEFCSVYESNIATTSLSPDQFILMEHYILTQLEIIRNWKVCYAY